ncbi:methylated-DNA-[protein]-cysteine S-methyltransferase [Thermomonospora echinospora]|uniref:Methylated-DNA-[protein]-cysteine S-methyltransferase n=1 Tax=Thermomonospora echinospora TaxID=1992 RepID=A0A1H6E065_9ACTN|nr:methylated-DNA--[protein]-cysteine S-methyltransferase [Thermomonospora echinospora]SEG90759.1 methylated-DNA-[protein]-cysteine S-methyltransferase [Thermomonospora echinospora]
MIKAMVLETPIGPLALLEHDGALIGGGFTADPGELHVRLHPSLRALELTATGDLGDLSKAHLAYFDGDLTALDTVPVHQPGSPRRERLLAALRAVRPGETVTYGELAARAGLERAARAAGQACAQNLVAPVVPCHRVLPAAGGKGLKRFGGYYYGPERKEWLLSHEATTR